MGFAHNEGIASKVGEVVWQCGGLMLSHSLDEKAKIEVVVALSIVAEGFAVVPYGDDVDNSVGFVVERLDASAIDDKCRREGVCCRFGVGRYRTAEK
jgi:hypothetical protein